MKIIKAPRTLMVCLISGSCLLSASAYAQMDSTTIADIARKAIETNPEVQASWHAFMASGHDTEFASGGYRPIVDFTAGYGYEHRDWENYDGKKNFSGAAAEITLTQMLYDGFRTRNEVRRFESAQLVRYFELLDGVENTAFQAVNAYEDVMRYRELVSLAEENYEEHITVFDQIEESANAGVARRADLEQISGRLSLAEANLLTEMSNLHDVSARYLRIVGELPAENMLPAQLNDTRIPADVREALQLAYQGNPAFHAAIRNIHSQEAAVDRRRSDFRPRLNLTARYGTQDYDDQGFSNRRNDGRVALEFQYNLYNGGRDEASLQRAYEEVNVAKHQRDKACVDLRQTLQIAVNDVRKLDEQLPVLNQHRISSDRVRTAYKDQFGIGDRTLLDVLDSENEYFQASRAYTNAVYDRSIAAARTLTSMGELLPALDVVREGLPSLSDLGAETFMVDGESACPDLDVNSSMAQSRLLR
ncbi:TolC family outer membrane protein [Nitrincola sp.]|uniref:TolC family outer membrane protein n=1 Tax=Nitrincola sp. TaxID=1926584 RepID=UPI003A91D39C